MSILDLLQAALFLEEQEREAGLHAYSSSHSLGTSPIQSDESSSVLGTIKQHSASSGGSRRSKSKKSHGSRTTHNELEKNRRAHLRNCLEKLKEIVPLGPESNRHTTLGLLTKAKSFIKNLEDKDCRHKMTLEQLLKEQRYLQERLDQLGGTPPTGLSLFCPMSIHKQRSISECSSGVSSNSSTSDHDTSENTDHFESSSLESVSSFANLAMQIEQQEQANANWSMNSMPEAPVVMAGNF